MSAVRNPKAAPPPRRPLTLSRLWLVVVALVGSLAALSALLYNFSVGPVGHPLIGRISGAFIYLCEVFGAMGAGAVGAAIVARRTGRVGSSLVALALSVLFLAFMLKTGWVANNVLPPEPYSQPQPLPSLLPIR